VDVLFATEQGKLSESVTDDDKPFSFAGVGRVEYLIFNLITLQTYIDTRYRLVRAR
jgi:hypothetical protein